MVRSQQHCASDSAVTMWFCEQFRVPPVLYCLKKIKKQNKKKQQQKTNKQTNNCHLMTCSQSYMMTKGGQTVKALLVRYHYIPFMGICSNLLYSELCSFHNVPACHNFSCEIFHNLLDNTVFKGTLHFSYYYFCLAGSVPRISRSVS